MLLGTFQIDQEFAWKKVKYPELVSRLGYFPKFCFKAETARDVLKYGLISAPNSVDNLFIFDATIYQPVNSVYWNRYYVTKENEDLDKSFKDLDSACIEYLVSGIENLKYQLRPQKWMPKGPAFHSMFIPAMETAEKKFGKQSTAYRFCEIMNERENEYIEDWVKPRLQQGFHSRYNEMIAAIRIFKTDYLYFHYAYNCLVIDFRNEEINEEQFLDAILTLPVFDWKRYRDLHIYEMICDLANYDTGLAGKTKENALRISSEIDQCISEACTIL